MVTTVCNLSRSVSLLQLKQPTKFQRSKQERPDNFPRTFRDEKKHTRDQHAAQGGRFRRRATW